MKPRLSDETPDLWDRMDDEPFGHPAYRDSNRREQDDLSDLFDDPLYGEGDEETE